MDLDTVIARARQVATEVLGPEARSVDEERRWPETGIRALRAIRPDVPVIICTGYNEDPSFKATGPSAFLQKPFKLANLMTKLEEVLSKPPD